MLRRILIPAAMLFAAAAPALAQDPGVTAPKQAISGNPILAVAEIFLLEYERALTPNWTGVGGLAYWAIGDEEDDGETTIVTTDLKARFYPGGAPLEGFSIGGIVGLSTVSYKEISAEPGVDDVDEEQAGLALGVDLNWSWLLGDQKRWFVGTGIGAKRYFIDFEDEDVDVSLVLPTARLNFGFAF